MPKNITVYIPDEVATEMDKFSEVSWSEVCRDAILEYVARRTKGFQPSSVNVTLDDPQGVMLYDGKPYLMLRFNLVNSSGYEILFDRARYELNIQAGNLSIRLVPQNYLEPAKILKGNAITIQAYRRLTRKILREIAQKIGFDSDVIIDLSITSYLHGPLGLFSLGHSFRKRIPNSDWRKQFPSYPEVKTKQSTH